MSLNVSLNPNRVVQFLKKEPSQFLKSDIIRFVKENEIKMINFMYPADDNRLKTLNFVINSEEYLDSILTFGERVDGSSLFPFIEAGNSDLYVIPKYSTAFVDPFAEIPTLSTKATPCSLLLKTLFVLPRRHSKRLPAWSSTPWESLSIT